MLTLPHRRALLTRKRDFDPSVNLLEPRSNWDGTSVAAWTLDSNDLGVSGGEFIITGGGFGFPQSGQAVSNLLKIGATYRLQVTGRLGTADPSRSPAARVSEGSPDFTFMSWNSTTPETKTVDFVADSTTFHMILYANTANVPVGETMYWDDIYLYRIA